MNTWTRAALGVYLLCTAGGVAHALGAADLQAKAVTIHRAGAIAAGFSAIAEAEVPLEQVDEAFASLGPEIQAVARQWARDGELRDAPPAFRRLLFFEYLTQDTDIVAGASNPPDRLINIDAAIDNLIADGEVARVAAEQMQRAVDEPLFSEVNGYLLATFPMNPDAETRAQCIACHASTEVGRPYPPDARVLGYTFVVQPIPK